MRDFLGATRDRVIVYDGGMGATLEQLELSLERDYRLPGRCHEALVLNRPDVIEGVHRSMIEAGAHVLEADTFRSSAASRCSLKAARCCWAPTSAAYSRRSDRSASTRSG